MRTVREMIQDGEPEEGIFAKLDWVRGVMCDLCASKQEEVDETICNACSLDNL